MPTGGIEIFTDEDLLPISVLQHYAFCPRQCALIHIERVWHENFFTAQGRNLHERVDKGGERPGANIKVEYAVQLRSYKLGLYGKADVVEFHLKKDECPDLWVPYPVEYKRGRPKKDDWDRIQLCAQAMCLEEQLNTKVEYGALFYATLRRRERVQFDSVLREITQKTAYAVHELIRKGRVPRAEKGKRCRSCSLMEVCMPELVHGQGSVKAYINTFLETL